MAANGMNGHGASDCLQWHVGLVNSAGKYLTAETFGFKINASSQTMKKKQLWVIEHDTKEDDVVYVKSHLGRYLGGDKRGNVTCQHEAKGEPDTKFIIQYNPDGSGRWAIRNKQHGYYFGGSEDSLRCYEKTPGATEWWTVRLAVHPQVNIRNVNRKKYAHLKLGGDTGNPDRLQCDEIIPWGCDALITLEFRDGKYAVKSSDNRYLHQDGRLVEAPAKETLYTLEIRSGQYSGMALKDSSGRYLTAVGRDAVMQGRNKNVSKDELFSLEDSHPQVFFTAHNGKKVSTKQGVDLTANQDEVSDFETFQVEYDRKAQQWRIRTSKDKYWSLEHASGIQEVGNDRSASGLFGVEWQDDGAIAIKAQNGRYVTAKMNGSLYAVSDAPGDKEMFFMTIINRPILVLKCDYGFVGFKSPSNPRIECNKAAYDVIHLEHTGGVNASYYLKGTNGKYWNVDNQGMINADSGEPQSFIFELRGQSRFSIKAPNNCYIKGEQNGIFSAKSTELSKATLWEY